MGSKDVGYVRLGFARASSILLSRHKLPQSDGSSAEAPCLVCFDYFSSVFLYLFFRRSAIVSDESKAYEASCTELSYSGSSDPWRHHGSSKRRRKQI